MPSKNRILRLRCIGLSVIMLICLGSIYAQTIFFDFVNLDDLPLILENPHLKELSWENIKWYFTGSLYGNWIPLTNLSFAILYQLFKFNPLPYHLLNTLLHVCNTFIVWRLIYLLFEISIPRINHTKIIIIASWAGALFWGIHPLRVESVAWVIELKDVLFTFFYLLSIHSYLLYLHHIKPHGAPRNYYADRHYLFCFAFFILSGLSKPMAITLPVCLLLLDCAMARRDWILIVREKIPLFFFSLFICLMTLAATAEMRPDFNDVTLFDRLITGFYGLGFYFEKTLFPVKLAVIYHYGMADPTVRELVVISGVASGLLFFLVLKLANRTSRLALAFYVITLSPVLGFFQIGSQEVADRFSYLPSVVFSLAIGYFFIRAFDSEFLATRKRFASVLLLSSGLCITVLLCTLSHAQAHIWRNSFSLWTHQLSIRPDAKALFSLTKFFYNKHDYHRASIYSMEGTRLFPENEDFLIYSAICHFILGAYDQAYVYSQKSLDLNPHSLEALRIKYVLEKNSEVKASLTRKILYLESFYRSKQPKSFK